METGMFFILILIIILGFALVILQLRHHSLHEENSIVQKQREMDLLRQQLSLSQSTDQNLLMKTQQTVTSIEAMNRQVQLLFRELNQLGKDTAASGATLDQVQEHVLAMNRIMVNKKARGNWGEYQLGMLLELYAGDCTEVYERQYSLQNGMIADFVLHLAGTAQVLCIDSKFPMENFQKVIENEGQPDAYARSLSTFKSNIKKHIQDIARKYITPQTSEQAIMFVPSEAVYMFLCSDCSSLLEYALQQHVLITSPTTLIGVVFTLVHATREMRRGEHIKEIEKEIIDLLEDANRLTIRLEKSAHALEQAMSVMNDAQISANKIAKRIEKIHDGK